MIENSKRTEYKILVEYEWFNSPHKDYTLSLYSKHDTKITDDSGKTNMLHTDGQQPSELVNSDFCGMDKLSCSACPKD